MRGMLSLKVINCSTSWNIFSNTIKRCFCNAIQEGNSIQRLNNRGLLSIRGDEVVPYLQGLITNDMRHLQEKPGSMYTLFLNTKGRVLYDSIIYSTGDSKSYLIECDSTVLNQLQKHLNMFKVKRKLQIDVHPNNVWVLFNNNSVKNISFNQTDDESVKLKSKTTLNIEKNDKCLIFKDPRVNLLGLRILCEESLTKDDIISMLNITDVTNSNDDDYRKFRYRLGVGEGVSDLPQGTCFPLEANADYLHGVSFHKGCYIGQELTARTHHTGVIRKRLMPLLFEKEIQSESVAQDSPIFGSENDKTSCGKVRGVANDVGLGLLRIAQVSQEPYLNVSGNKAKTYKPFWWPEEAPKEKVSVG